MKMNIQCKRAQSILYEGSAKTTQSSAGIWAQMAKKDNYSLHYSHFFQTRYSHVYKMAYHSCLIHDVPQ